MNTDIQIKKLNESLCFVDGTPQAIADMVRYFTTMAPNYRFSPKYKNGFWNGEIYHFHPSTQHLSIGLVQEVGKFAARGGYTISTDFEHGHSITTDLFQKFVKALDIRILDRFGKPIPDAKPRHYQMQSVYDALKNQHLNIEVPTSGGKTLISYLIARYLAARKKKMILIVPTTTLVEQTYGDWFDFGWDEVRDNVHRIYGGQEKYFGSPVTISTWQSLYKNKEIFEQFDCVLIDEAHGAAAKSMNNIAKWCCNAEWRIGMSGTMPDFKNKDERSNYFNIVGALGPIKVYTTYKEMEIEGWIPKIQINVILLKYSQQRRKEMAITINEAKIAERDAKKAGLKSPGSPFMIEADIINNIKERNNFICDLIEKSCKGNALVLFTKKSKHGVPLKELFEKEFRNKKKVLYVDGDISTDDRNMIRKRMDVEDDIILLASFATFATGISIKNVHNIIFASNYKSKIKILQAIGRGLRKMEGKTKITIFDLVDDCSINMKNVPKYTNYALKHYNERKEIYEAKGLNWRSIRYNL